MPSLRAVIFGRLSTQMFWSCHHQSTVVTIHWTVYCRWYLKQESCTVNRVLFRYCRSSVPIRVEPSRALHLHYRRVHVLLLYMWTLSSVKKVWQCVFDDVTINKTVNTHTHTRIQRTHAHTHTHMYTLCPEKVDPKINSCNSTKTCQQGDYFPDLITFSDFSSGDSNDLGTYFHR